MKKMKKILAFIMAMAMVLGMSVTSFAATKADGESDFGKAGDRGSIVITGIDKEENISIALYPVVEAKYDAATGVFAEYAVVKDVDGADLYNLTKDADDNYVIDAETLDAIGNKAQTNGTALADIEWVYDEAAKGYKTKTDSVPVGMYLVLITGAEAKIYNYAVASLYYTVDENGQNAIDGGKLELENAQIAAKVSDRPDVEKTAKDEAGKVVPSANIGDKICYTLEVNPVPYYGGENPVLNLVDTLSTGLSFQGDVVVKVEGKDEALTAGKDYTVLTPADEAELDADKKTLNEGQIKIDFVVDGKYTLNDYAGKKVTVTYSAILNENAAMNNVGNTNGVVLNYTKDSKVNEGVDDKTEEKKTYTYTFDIDGTVDGKVSVTEGILTKIGEELNTETNSYALKNAVFTLYTKNPDALTEEEKAEDYVYKNYKVNEDGSKVALFEGTVISDTKGQLPVHGLAEGTYYLKETAAPEGYTLNTHVFEIKIEATYENMAADAENRGQLVSWTITIDGKTTNTFTVDQGTVTINKGVTVEEESVEGKVIGIDIPNTKISSLPSTGGIGTTIFTVGGCLIMIVAAGLFFASRRKSAK